MHAHISFQGGANSIPARDGGGREKASGLEGRGGRHHREEYHTSPLHSEKGKPRKSVLADRHRCPARCKEAPAPFLRVTRLRGHSVNTAQAPNFQQRACKPGGHYAYCIQAFCGKWQSRAASSACVQRAACAMRPLPCLQCLLVAARFRSSKWDSIHSEWRK